MKITLRCGITKVIKNKHNGCYNRAQIFEPRVLGKEIDNALDEIDKLVSGPSCEITNYESYLGVTFRKECND